MTKVDQYSQQHMTETTKKVLAIGGVVLFVYVAFFGAWLALTYSCVDRAIAAGTNPYACGDNDMTRTVRTYYHPFIWLYSLFF